MQTRICHARICHTLSCLASILFCCDFSAAAELDFRQQQALAGKWQIRIDGGGEIYSARLNLKWDTEASGLVGNFSSDGKKAAIHSVSREDDLYVVKFKTRRRGLPVNVMFAFQLIENRLVGDVDFDSGTSVRSYEFEASRVTSESKKVAEQVTAANASLEEAAAELQPASPSKTPRSFRNSRKLAFQNGENNYAGSIDTEIWSIAPSKSLFRQGTLTTDGNNGGGESQVLMRFADVFGDDSGQVPKLSRIVSAKLIVVAFDPGSTIYLHRMLVPWDDSATWDGMARGITVDNVEASTVRDGFSFGEVNMDKQAIEFDVTATAQKWSNGEPNYGWVFMSTGSNGWDFYSSDWIEADSHPRLEIEFETPSLSTKKFATASHKEARKP